MVDLCRESLAGGPLDPRSSALHTILCNFAAELRRSILSPVHGRLLHDHVKLSRGRETFQTADKASDVKANSNSSAPSAIKVSLEIYHVSLPTTVEIPPSLIHEDRCAMKKRAKW